MNLSELIKACGEHLKDLTQIGESQIEGRAKGSWMTNNISSPRTYGATPEEAVKKLLDVITHTKTNT